MVRAKSWRGDINIPGGIVKALLQGFLIFMISIPLFGGDGQIDILPSGTATCTISTSGSYVLVDNVTMKADVNCIEITTDDVTLDLNGHTIAGNGSNHYGILGSTINRAVILNGTIRNFGNTGIYLGADCHLRDITVSNNGKYGMEAGNNCLIESCKARYSTGGIGIKTGSYSTIKNCISSNNSILSGNGLSVCGISASSGCTIINNICYNNENKSTGTGKACGILAGLGCTIINNSCYGNKVTNDKSSMGILASNGCTVIGNTCTKNDTTGNWSASYGIQCEGYCLVKDNTCSENTAPGSGGFSTGILSNGNSNLIIGNNCSNNKGNSSSYGIYITGYYHRVENNLCSKNDGGSNKAGICVIETYLDCVIIRNTTNSNGNGINLNNGGHYCAENMCSDGIINTSGVTLGSGDRSNVGF